jgi:hypothetical protein
LPRHRVSFTIALACATALTVAGCKNSAEVFQDQNDGGWFSNPLFSKPDWAPTSKGGVNLGPQGPVGAEDMVSADGVCAAPAAAASQAAEPSTPAAGSVAGDAAGATTVTPASANPNSGLQRLEPASGPQVSGGIGLGMTECQVVQRAGSPSSVAISGGERGDRKVVLTYLSGPWPGIYTFTGGRLNVVDRTPEQPKPAAPKKTPKKKPSASTVQQGFQRSSVQ